MKGKKKAEIAVVLPDIRSSHNVGSIFRTSDGAGVSRIVLAGYTPCPTDKFGRQQKEISKTALGAEKSVPWTYEKSPKKALQNLKKEGFFIIAIEQSDRSVDYRKARISSKRKIAFVFGNEVEGLTKELLNLCDLVAHIPMKGMKESLNVSVAAGAALFRMIA